MKKNKMMRIASVLLVAVLLSTSVISGTFAKYTSTATGTDSARVAKWDIQFNNAQMPLTNTFSFDLFKDYTDENVDVNGANDDAIVIAPGTKGDFTIELTNSSEVNAHYKIDYVVTNANNIPVMFRVTTTAGEGNPTVGDWTSDIADIAFVDFDMNDSVTYKIEWQWAFNGTDDGAADGQTDTTDTTLGLAGTATITVDATITVEQVN